MDSASSLLCTFLKREQGWREEQRPHQERRGDAWRNWRALHGWALRKQECCGYNELPGFLTSASLSITGCSCSTAGSCNGPGSSLPEVSRTHPPQAAFQGWTHPNWTNRLADDRTSWVEKVGRNEDIWSDFIFKLASSSDVHEAVLKERSVNDSLGLNGLPHLGEWMWLVSGWCWSDQLAVSWLSWDSWLPCPTWISAMLH